MDKPYDLVRVVALLALIGLVWLIAAGLTERIGGRVRANL